MSAIFPPRTQAAARPAPPPASRETLAVARQQVRRLLESSDAFNQLAPDKRESLAKGMVQIASYLAEPDGVRLKPEQQSPQVRALAGENFALKKSAGNNTDEEGKFTAQSAREGAAVAGALLEAVNFPDFCAGLIDGVFHSIVKSSIEQMEAYAKLVADVSKSLNQFRDDNTTQNQGRDHLIEQFPDVFQLSMDTGEFSFGDEQPAGPRVTVREGVNEKAAVAKINQSLPLDKPIERLDDELVEALLVPAARTQLATSRQQLLATMVMLGINRIVVTDGKISAKVMYDFKARDNMQFRRSAQKFDYDKKLQSTTSEGTNEQSSNESNRGFTRSADGAYDTGGRDASFYTKGTYKTTAQPVLNMASASQTSINASLETKASLAGSMEVNFKSDYLPLEKLANPEAIAAIQMNAQPGMVKTMASRPPAPAAGQTPPATAPAA
jgi:hypothetical protein